MSSVAPIRPLFWITGPPAAGKTTLCEAILQRYERGLHLHVDDLRSWVVQGLADSVPWTEETERQFQIAEAATCDVAKRYHTAGFAVAVDHCRNLPRLTALLDEHFDEQPLVKVCLLPNLEVNLYRNETRTNKPFGPELLLETIKATNAFYRANSAPGWLIVDNTQLSICQTLDVIWEHYQL